LGGGQRLARGGSPRLNAPTLTEQQQRGQQQGRDNRRGERDRKGHAGENRAKYDRYEDRTEDQGSHAQPSHLVLPNHT
jgi:hypothetical protein